MCFICPLLSGCVNQDSDLRMKKAYLRQFGIKDVEPEDVVIDYDGGMYNGARIVMLDAEWHNPEDWTESIGETNIQYYDSNRILVYIFGKFYTLTEAQNQNIIFAFQIKKIANEFNNVTLHFRDTCDKHDFDEFWYWDNLEMPSAPEGEKPISNMIGVDIDIRVCSTDGVVNKNFNVVEYLGTDIISKMHAVALFEDFARYYLKIVNDGLENIPQIFEQLKQIPGVLSAGYYWSVYDPSCSTLNNANTLDNTEWGIEYIEATKVWDFATGSANTYVGIIDSGINSHSDLIGNLNSGYNFVNNNNITTDSLGHGTTVAGVIGANGNVLGVNWIVGLVPYKVYPMGHPKDGYDVLTYYVKSAIDKATDSYLESINPVKIINISLGEILDDNSLKQAISEYPGLLVVCASNDNINIDVEHQYPGLYGSELYGEGKLNNIIVVGALDENGDRWYELIDGYATGSNYGGSTVDIYAPGSNIRTTTAQGGYAYKTGTSFAAPHVSGVAALLLSVEPNLTGAQLKDCILNGADDITITVGDNNDITQNVKKLNAWGAFKHLMENYYTFDSEDIYSVGILPVQFNDSIESTDDYSTFKENTSFIKLNVQSAGHYNFTASANNDIKVALYDSNYELISEKSTYTTGVANLDFLSYLQQGTYYLKTTFLEEITGDGEITFSINYTQEGHQVAHYLLYNSTHHRCVCGCGTLIGLSIHTVKFSEVTLGIGHCMYCGAKVILDNTIVQVPGLLNVQKVTINGSYILPNGIIVLVDEDIEAYENGTLVFYDKDDLPVTQ